MSLTGLRHQSLDSGEVVAAVSDDAAGAVVTFVGVVRNHNRGQPITRLDYKAYDRMAESELAAIAQEIEAEIEGVKVAALHRVGMLAVGDLAVVCAASAAHRAEAFAACRELIERIKTRLPIWKREYGPDGPHWVGWQAVADDSR
jgi:molybdopterin synthase catalytic subunit